MTQSRPLHALLEPESVAVVGASDDMTSFGGRIWTYLTGSYRGRAVAVNTRSAAVRGAECLPDLNAVHPPPQAVVLATPAGSVLGLMEQAGRIGSEAVVVFARDLLGREQEIRQVADRFGLTVLGPNCLGLIHANAGVILSSSISLDRPYRGGSIAFVGQSGAIMGVAHARAADLGIGLGLCVSTGSQAQVRTEDVLLEIARRDDISAVAVYLEDVDVALLTSAAGRLAERGIRLVVLKGGMTPAGSERAAVHSGAMAGSGRAFTRLAADLGLILVDDLHGLLLTAAATLIPGRRWHVATLSGALAAVAADQAALLGLELAAPLEPAAGNPVDLEAAPTSPAQNAARIARLAADGNADGVLTVLSDSPGLAELAGLLQPSAGDGLGRIVVATECSSQLDDVWAAWRGAGSAVFPGLIPTLRAMAASRPPGVAAVGSGRTQPDLISPVEAARLLEDAGLPMLALAEVETPEAARSAAEQLGYPVVLKASRAARRGLGGVRPGLDDAQQVTSAFAELTHLRPLLVQPEAEPGLEFYLGIARDPTFGWLLVLGAGGQEVEELDDVTISPLPLAGRDAADLLAATKVGRWLRAQPARRLVRLDALLKVVEIAAGLPEWLGPHVAAVDLNPVIVHRHGASVVDAKISLLTKGRSGEHSPA
jgi:acetate---CoA ligase (ADP-forming)